jgi:hypothetical protein
VPDKVRKARWYGVHPHPPRFVRPFSAGGTPVRPGTGMKFGHAPITLWRIVVAMPEYRATLIDGTIKGFDQMSADALMDQHGIVQLPGETAYAFRLRALRYLSGQNIVNWRLAEYDAPVFHALGMCAPGDGGTERSSSWGVGLLLLALATLGLLILTMFTT